MGMLMVATQKEKMADGTYKSRPGQFRGNYQNKDATQNLIHYVTRTGDREDRKSELISWGVIGAYDCLPMETIIHIFEQVQIIGRENRKMGPKMFHEIYVCDERQMRFFLHRLDLLQQFAYMAARIYYDRGFQVVYAAHMEPNDPEKMMHIHFAVNAVCYIDGKKWHTNLNEDQREREAAMNSVYESLLQVVCPIRLI